MYSINKVSPSSISWARMLFVTLIILTQNGKNAFGYDEYGVPEVYFTKITPENNSEITSFNFKLEFDISETEQYIKETLELFPNDVYFQKFKNQEIGIIYRGVYQGEPGEYGFFLYEGDIETGVEQTRILYNARNADIFFQSGNVFSFNIPGFIPKDGQSYTLKIVQNFRPGIFDSDGKFYGAFDESFSCHYAPLIFTFIGKSVENPPLMMVRSDLTESHFMSSVNNPKLEFNYPVKIKEGAKALTYAVANSPLLYKRVDILPDPDNDHIVYLNTGNLKLSKDQEYQFAFEKGLICRADYESDQLDFFNIFIQGDEVQEINVRSAAIEESYGYPFYVDLKMDAIPDAEVFKVKYFDILTADKSEVIVDNFKTNVQQHNSDKTSLKLFLTSEIWDALEFGKTYNLRIREDNLVASYDISAIAGNLNGLHAAEIILPFRVPDLTEDVAPFNYSFSGEVHLNGHKSAAIKDGDIIPLEWSTLHVPLNKNLFKDFRSDYVVTPLTSEDAHIDVIHIMDESEELYAQIPVEAKNLIYYDKLHSDDFIIPKGEFSLTLEQGEKYRLEFAPNQLHADYKYMSLDQDGYYKGSYFPSYPWVKSEGFQFEFTAGEVFGNTSVPEVEDLLSPISIYRVDGSPVAIHLTSAEFSALQLEKGIYLKVVGSKVSKIIFK